jgi:hypothetical protein
MFGSIKHKLALKNLLTSSTSATIPTLSFRTHITKEQTEMDVPRDSESLSFEKTAKGLKRLMNRGEVPEISGQGTRAIEAWFLGPKGENVDVLERLVVEAIRDQAFWRRNYHPSDPTHITEEMRRSPEYLQAMDSLQQGFRDLLSFLKKSFRFLACVTKGT